MMGKRLAESPSILVPILAALLVLVSSIATLHAEVAPVDWPSLIEHADVIVIATEVRVEEPAIDGETWKIGVARVDAYLAGLDTEAGAETVHYVAEPTWFCDISTAEPGSRVVLFLDGGDDGDAMARKAGIDGRIHGIAWHGYGRIPISEKKTVSICDPYPKSLKRKALSEDRWGCIEIRLDDFVEDIRKRRAVSASDRLEAPEGQRKEP